MQPLPDDGARIDATIPSAARVYDYLLGGKDNFTVDRELAESIQAQAGGWREAARVNRGFILKSVRWCAAMRGISQFLDLGSGWPRQPSVHGMARSECPEAVVAYVDKDPAVTCRTAVLSVQVPGVAAVMADVSDPAAVLELVTDLEVPGGGRLVDLARPAAIVLGGTLSAMPADAARGAVTAYAAAMAPGSVIVASCLSYEDQAAGDAAEALYRTAGEWHNHPPAVVASFFAAADLELVHGQVDDARRLSRDLAAELLSRSAAVSRSSPAGPRPAAAVLGGIGIKDGGR